MLCRIFWPFLLFWPSWPRVQAAVDLVTLPTREGTQLTIYNSEDITMVREHRLLTVKEGVNRIQFSWANTLIDPTTIEFRILDQQDKVDLVDTTFPAGRNDALQWNIKSQIAGKIPVEIRYFTSGITWAADYVGIANEDETKLAVTGYVRVTNGSGEVYDNAQTRLVVGKINLVEKIADLARRPAPGEGAIGGQRPRRVRIVLSNARRLVREADERRSRNKDSTRHRSREKPKQVVKQGLSEYFLFTIEGREDIKDKEPKRLVALKVAEVPLESIYKLSDRSQSSPLPPARGTRCPPADGRGAGGEGIVHQVLPLQERQAAGRPGQGEEALGHGEPGPLAAAQRHGQALLGVQEQGPGLRGRHGDQVRAHRRPRGSERRAGQGHHDPAAG